MSYRLDYEEPVVQVIERLRQEHVEIDGKLRRILEIARTKNGNLKVAVSLLTAERTEILRHAVEEEARIARVIMNTSDTRERSDESVKILQEHRRIKEFLDEDLPYLLDENSEKEAKKEIAEFIDLVISHHREEEKETFPLALQAA